ncbi:MAG: fructose PTS transporter subunit IIB [Anaerolineaceae bacterium]|nr:fructose PTS transporter subunit IIB [Anaerolineaceae bacterium]
MKKIVGVASCPAGIAHTYLAAESIIKAGNKKGYTVKIETDGAGGRENTLTPEDINEAVAVIIAADTTVPMKRFDGKSLIEISTGEAIHRARQVIELVEKNELEIYKYQR